MANYIKEFFLRIIPILTTNFFQLLEVTLEAETHVLVPLIFSIRKELDRYHLMGHIIIYQYGNSTYSPIPSANQS